MVPRRWLVIVESLWNGVRCAPKTIQDGSERFGMVRDRHKLSDSAPYAWSETIPESVMVWNGSDGQFRIVRDGVGGSLLMVRDGLGSLFRRMARKSRLVWPIWDGPDGSVWFVRVRNVPRWSGSVDDVLGSALDGPAAWEDGLT